MGDSQISIRVTPILLLLAEDGVEAEVEEDEDEVPREEAWTLTHHPLLLAMWLLSCS